MKIKILILPIVFFIVCNSNNKVIGQSTISFDSAKFYFRVITSAYMNDTMQRLNVYSSLYNSDNPNVKIDSLVGKYYIQGKSILASMDNEVYLRNEKWALSIFNDAKEIYLDSIQNDNELHLRSNLFQMIDSTSADTALSYRLIDNGHDTAIIKANSSTTSRVFESTLVYRKSTGRLIFTEYKMPKQDADEGNIEHYYILKMIYEEPYIDENAGHVFNESKYIYFDENKQPHGAGIFNTYKIIMSF